VAALPLGPHEGIGHVVAGSERPDFPTQTEMLLLRVAANQAAIGLQEARRSSEQNRRAEEERRTLASLLENSTDVIGIASLDGHGLFVNAAGQQRVGLDGEDSVRGTTVFDYIGDGARLLVISSSSSIN
jgi:two-component system, LuxR family, sensor kinase FixL